MFYSNLETFVSETFNDEKYRDLEIIVKGHRQFRLLKVVAFDRLGMVSH